MPLDHLITERYHYSNTRLGELQKRLRRLDILKRFPALTIYATGSYARLEASKHSDIDLFFLYDGSDLPNSRMNTQRLFSKLVEIADDMNFPEFTNDGQYLEILFLDPMLCKLGGREDDSMNYFTARMLLLLESRNVYNEAVYNDCINKIVKAYFRDYPYYTDRFRPTFLVNDILRFWKTLCLNYEHERNIMETRTSRVVEDTVRNFKLKFSRMLTCFATVIALSRHREPVTPEEVIGLTAYTPRQRLELIKISQPDSTTLVDTLLNDYTWFLEKTGLAKEELHEHFTCPKNEEAAFRRADDFGTRMYNVLAMGAGPHGYMRYVVI